jgi:multidrug efflux pump subunit AcrB
MAIIPFGLVGTIYGHAPVGHAAVDVLGRGLIGMTGIIINDSIVLVTTIDDIRAPRPDAPPSSTAPATGCARCC